MKPQTSVVLPATKVTSQACCSELPALVLTSQVLLSRGGRGAGGIHLKVVLRVGEKGCVQFILEIITHLSVTASMSGGGERRLIFDNFISNISP